MPEPVFQHWLAYKRLQNPEYRQQAEWAALNQQEFTERQSSALSDIIGSAKAVAAQST